MLSRLNKKGLTLVEGLLALTILVVVLTTAVVVYLNFVKPAAEKSRKTSIFNAVLAEAEKYAGSHLNSAYPSADTMVLLLGGGSLQDHGVYSYSCDSNTMIIAIDFSTSKIAQSIVPEWNALIKQGYENSGDAPASGGASSGTGGACVASGKVVTCGIPVPNCEGAENS